MPHTMTLDPISMAALAAAATILLMLLAVHLRQRTADSRRSARREATDTVLGWQPEAARVLTGPELEAMALLSEATPGHVVLAQVPLSRFLRVPMRNSYAEWLLRVGNLNADLLLCDGQARVIAVVDVRAAQESERSKRRHERMVRVLRAAGIPVHAWRQDKLPSVADVRAQLDPLLSRHGANARARMAGLASSSRPMPLIPVPDITELLAEGDARAQADEQLEPVPSGFFDDLEMGTAVGAR
jgi:hypothetical protein